MTGRPGNGTWARVSRAAALDRRLSSEAFRVLAVLCCYADNTTYRCCPSVATIADHLGLTRRMAQLHLRRLEELGYVTTIRQKLGTGAIGRRRNGARMGGGWTANIYVLVYPPPPSLKRSDDAKPDFTSSTPDDAKFGDTDDAKSHFALARLDLTRKSFEEEDSVYQEETRVSRGANGQGETGFRIVGDTNTNSVVAEPSTSPANGKLTWRTPAYEIVELEPAEPKPEPTPSDISAQIARLRAAVGKLA